MNTEIQLEIIEAFKTYISTLNKELNEKELNKEFSNFVKKYNNPKKNDVKRAPSLYNQFIKNKQEELKQNPEYKSLAPKELFKLTASLWTEEKNKIKEDN